LPSYTSVRKFPYQKKWGVSKYTEDSIRWNAGACGQLSIQIGLSGLLSLNPPAWPEVDLLNVHIVVVAGTQALPLTLTMYKVEGTALYHKINGKT
jgi:hypothetical protein